MTDLARMAGMMEEIFDGLSVPFYTAKRTAYTSIPVNLSESRNEVILRFEIPGVTKSDINLQFEKGYIRVAVDKKQSSEDTEGEVNLIQEFPLKGSYSRKVKIAVPVNYEDVKAHYDQGILVIKIPKREQDIPKTITID